MRMIPAAATVTATDPALSAMRLPAESFANGFDVDVSVEPDFPAVTVANWFPVAVLPAVAVAVAPERETDT
jgi:hypothetical protein